MDSLKQETQGLQKEKEVRVSVMVLVSFPNLTLVAITSKGELLEISLGLVRWSMPIL